MQRGQPKAPSESAEGRERDRTEADSPELPTHAADGTDLTLVRWLLAKSPAERLVVLQSGARSLALLLDARARR